MCSNHTLLQLQTFSLMFALFWPVSEVETAYGQRVYISACPSTACVHKQQVFAIVTAA